MCKRIFILLVLAIGVNLFLAACGDGELGSEATPAEVMQAYNEATVGYDTKQLLALTCDLDRENAKTSIEELKAADFQIDDVSELQYEEKPINETKVVVRNYGNWTYTVNGVTKTDYMEENTLLVYEDSGWKICPSAP